jgi:hypothetical protein
MSSGHLNQVRVAWTGFLGAPGVSTFYYPVGSNPPLAALRTMFSTLSAYLPQKVNIQVQASGQTIDPADGSLVDSWSAGTAPASVTGTGTTAIMAASGFQIIWGTNEVADGHAVKGRTLFVPCMAALYDGDGQMIAANQTAAAAAGFACAGATPQMAVWHRPRKGPKPAGGGPAPITRAGSYALVTTATTPRKPVVLTSRRD